MQRIHPIHVDGIIHTTPYLPQTGIHALPYHSIPQAGIVACWRGMAGVPAAAATICEQMGVRLSWISDFSVWLLSYASCLQVA